MSTTDTAKGKYPVSGLTSAQREAFEAICCGQDPSYNPKTIAALLKKGAIVEVGEKTICKDMFVTVKIPVYEVPFALHLQWCAWCSAQEFPDDM